MPAVAKTPQEPAHNGRAEAAGEPQENDAGSSSPLDSFTVNLNAQAQAGKIDPLIGRPGLEQVGDRSQQRRRLLGLPVELAAALLQTCQVEEVVEGDRLAVEAGHA